MDLFHRTVILTKLFDEGNFYSNGRFCIWEDAELFRTFLHSWNTATNRKLFTLPHSFRVTAGFLPTNSSGWYHPGQDLTELPRSVQPCCPYISPWLLLPLTVYGLRPFASKWSHILPGDFPPILPAVKCGNTLECPQWTRRSLSGILYRASNLRIIYWKHGGCRRPVHRVISPHQYKNAAYAPLYQTFSPFVLLYST